MAVRIRLKRQGRKNRPFYRICVFDSRTRRDGASLEEIGFYDTVSNKSESETTVKVERARHWLSKGAKPSDTVHQIFKRNGVYETAEVAASGNE